jgi:hypothetical protein
MFKKILYFIFFILPFFLWLYFYLNKIEFVILFIRPIGENYLIIPFEDLWKVVLIFFIFQNVNLILDKLTSKKIFSLINNVFIFLHLTIVIYLIFLNYF